MMVTPRARWDLPVVLMAVSCLAGACAGQRSSLGQRRPMVPAEVVRVQPVVTSRATRIVQPNLLVGIEGSNCAQADRGVIEMPGSETLPDFATTGTVFLNGWKLRYLSGDHHVHWILAEIQEVKLEGWTLSWVARGLLADRNFDDSFEFCYWYVVLGWNQNAMDAATSNGDIISIGAAHLEIPPAEPLVDRVHAPVHASAYARIPEAAGKRTIAILPRGFALPTGDFYCEIGPERTCQVLALADRHVLQLSYVLGQSDRFRSAGDFNVLQDDEPFPGPSQVEAGLVSWRSSGILKDDSATVSFGLHEDTTAVFGNDVDIIEPPYAPFVRDNKPSPSTVIGGPGVQTEDVVVQNVPFQFVIPMLSGWELRYPYGDEHIAEVGVWVHDFFHSGQPATLQYKFSWILQDADGLPSNRVSHKVNILGLRAGSP